MYRILWCGGFGIRPQRGVYCKLVVLIVQHNIQRPPTYIAYNVYTVIN